MSKHLKTIAIDLMPLLPGGDNGGAKIFVLELLSKLVTIAPETTFILLMQNQAYPELQHLGMGNVRCIPLSTPSESLRRSGGYLSSLPLPKFLRTFGYYVYRRLRKHLGKQALVTIEADLLFCPFTTAAYDFNPSIPMVSVIYDLQHQTYPQFFSKAVCVHRDLVFKEACNKAKAIAVISEYSRQSVLQHSTFNPSRVRTIYLQLGERFENPTVDEKEVTFAALARQYSLKTQQYLLYPANYWMHKNHERLIEAFKSLQKNLPATFRLIFTGADSERQRVLQTQIESCGLSERIIFAGYLTNHELAVLLSYSTGVIFPSLYEGFGLPVIEAMTLGIPVACSNVTALPEVAADAALLFDPTDIAAIAAAMQQLIGDSLTRKTLSRKGLARARDFSNATQMAEAYWKLFEEVVNAS